MGGGEAGAELLGQPQPRRVGQPPRLVEHVAQRHAAHELHGDEGDAVHLAEVVGAQHVGMGDLARQLELALQAVELVAVAPEVALQHLEGDQVVQLAVARLVDDPHAAGAEHGEDLEARAQQGSRRDAGEGGGAGLGQRRRLSAGPAGTPVSCEAICGPIT